MADLDTIDMPWDYAEADNAVDLSLLTSVLCRAQLIKEDDRVWEPGVLLQQLASELTQEEEIRVRSLST